MLGSCRYTHRNAWIVYIKYQLVIFIASTFIRVGVHDPFISQFATHVFQKFFIVPVYIRSSVYAFPEPTQLGLYQGVERADFFIASFLGYGLADGTSAGAKIAVEVCVGRVWGLA